MVAALLEQLTASASAGEDDAAKGAVDAAIQSLGEGAAWPGGLARARAKAGERSAAAAKAADASSTLPMMSGTR